MSGVRRYVAPALAVAALLALLRVQGLAQAGGPASTQPPPSTASQPPKAATPPPAPMPALPQPTKQTPALSVPPPLYPTTEPEQKQFTFERVFTYRRMSYKPPIVIQRIPRSSASNATPEQAFAAQISAMLAGDYDWWLSNWDANGQKFHKERNQQMQRSPAEWRNIWDRALRGQQVRMTERVVTGPFGPYVMLLYEMHDTDDKLTLKSNFVAKEEAGRWVATLDLSEDPLYQYFDLGKDKVSVTER
jgi:hypothetical protein